MYRARNNIQPRVCVSPCFCLRVSVCLIPPFLWLSQNIQPDVRVSPCFCLCVSVSHSALSVAVATTSNQMSVSLPVSACVSVCLTPPFCGYDRVHVGNTPKRGTIEPFSGNLPGFVDNIRLSPRGTYWVGLSSVRHKDAPSVLDRFGSLPSKRRELMAVSCTCTASVWQPKGPEEQ